MRSGSLREESGAEYGNVVEHFIDCLLRLARPDGSVEDVREEYYVHVVEKLEECVGGFERRLLCS